MSGNVARGWTNRAYWREGANQVNQLGWGVESRAQALGAPDAGGKHENWRRAKNAGGGPD